MVIKVLVKSIAKTRGVESVAYLVDDNINTLNDLIIDLCNTEITKYENKEFKVLSQEDIDWMVNIGKISFGFKYRDDENVDRNEAFDNALVAFNEGLYRVFINEVEIDSLDCVINLKEDDEVSLIRLTMMTGRY